MIKDSAFYNNGIGLVPNTLDSEPFEPTGDSTIKDNDIFWNNFNYFLPASPVQTVSNGLGALIPARGGTLQYPTGYRRGAVRCRRLDGQGQQHLRQLHVGSGRRSPIRSTTATTRLSQNNQVIDNSMGRDGTDTNGRYDFWVDGSGSGNCFEGNDSSTFSPSYEAHPDGHDHRVSSTRVPGPGRRSSRTPGSGTSDG